MSTWFQQHQKQSLFVLLFLIAGMAYVSLRKPADTPAAQVERIVRELVAAAEDKNLKPFRKYLSEEVRDDQGRGKKEILNILRAIFFRHGRISLSLIHLDVVESAGSQVFSADLSLLMGEQIVPTEKGNFFVTFRRQDGQWRVWEVKWDQGYGY